MKVCVWENGSLSVASLVTSGTGSVLSVSGERGQSTTMRGSTAGITDGLRGHSALHYAFLTLLDTLLAALVISPLVVCYWRGTWLLMDVYVYPEQPQYSALVSLCGGLGGILLFTLVQSPLSQWLHPDRHRLIYYLTSRGYTAVFGFCCVNSWRGAWKVLDLYTGSGVDVVVTVTMSAVAVLAGARTLRNISAPPFAVVTDRREGYFEVPTMFKYVSTSGDAAVTSYMDEQWVFKDKSG